MPSLVAAENKSVPLCVDLDGTAIKTDLLWESMVQVVRRNPLYLFAVLLWWLRGRAFLKAQLATRSDLEMANLPVDKAFWDFLRAEVKSGRRVILVTASDQHLAEKFAQQTGLFNEVMGSNGHLNLRGRNKARHLVSLFGPRGFDYAGNCHVDLPVWEQARCAIAVNCGASVVHRARQRTTVSHVFTSPQSVWQAWLRVVRPHQWLKNLILFVPLITSHQIANWHHLRNVILGFAAFSLCAAAGYILNDILDADSDRHHPGKRFRPFAAGTLTLQSGLAVAPVFLALGALLALTLPWAFGAALAAYVVVNTLYSWRLKQEVLVDVFLLAGLYTIRLIAGHGATGIPHSVWLLVFSMFIFLSLALVKRFVELEAARQQNRGEIRGRGYRATDLPLVASLGPTCGYLSVLIVALYANSLEVKLLYQSPLLLLLICPLLLFWISRIWLIAHRGQMNEDPVVFALKDRVSYLVGALSALVIWLATRF